MYFLELSNNSAILNVLISFKLIYLKIKIHFFNLEKKIKQEIEKLKETKNKKRKTRNEKQETKTSKTNKQEKRQINDSENLPCI